MSNPFLQLNDIKLKFNELCEKMTVIDSYWNDILLLTLKAEDEGFKDSLDDYDLFFTKVINSFALLFTVKAYSLLSPKEAGSIKKYISSLLNSHRNSEWNDKITIENLQQIESEFEVILNSNAYTALLNLRHKVHAHSEKNGIDKVPKTTFEEIDVLVNDVKSILQKLSEKLFEMKLQFNDSEVWGASMFNKHTDTKALLNAISRL